MSSPMDTSEKLSPMKRVMTWIGYFSALVGFFATLAGGYHWLQNRREQSAELKSQMAVAEVYSKQGEYQSAISAYTEILKTHPLNGTVLDAQLKVAMDWTENFHALGREDKDPSEVAGPLIDQIIPILDAGMVRSKGSDLSTVQSHLGWAHFLNHKIAKREFGSAAEDNLRGALKIEPSNVYANAMLGNWLLQNQGSLGDAVAYFNTAIATGQVRTYVRTLQLGALEGLEGDGVTAELMKVANAMRKNNEPVEDGAKHHILELCCDPPMTDHKNLVGALSAVPRDEARQTYSWLANNKNEHWDTPIRRLTSDFLDATFLEMDGKNSDALERYKSLQKPAMNLHASLQDAITESIARLSRK